MRIDTTTPSTRTVVADFAAVLETTPCDEVTQLEREQRKLVRVRTVLGENDAGSPTVIDAFEIITNQPEYDRLTIAIAAKERECENYRAAQPAAEPEPATTNPQPAKQQQPQKPEMTKPDINERHFREDL